MARVSDADFMGVVSSENGSSMRLCYGRFDSGCKEVYGDELKRCMRSFMFCANILVPARKVFRRFRDDGELEDFERTGMYWAGVWQDPHSGRSVWGILDSSVLSPSRIHRMIEAGYCGEDNGFNFAKMTTLQGMRWHAELTLDGAADRRSEAYVWAVITDGSSHGYYENAAGLSLYATEDEAVAAVRERLGENVNDAFFGDAPATKDQFDEKFAACCKWYGKDQAQFRNDGAVTDYRIERMPIPKEEKKS